MDWTFLTQWFSAPNKGFIFAPVDPSHVAMTNGSPPTVPVQAVADLHYFRFRVAEMFLDQGVAWAKEWYPAVHSLVECNFAGKTVQIPDIADASSIAQQKSQGGEAIILDYPLTPTLPFKGGTVTWSAGLVGMQGQNYLQKLTQTLQQFGDLLKVPQVSAALSVAAPLAAGIQDLFSAGNGQMHMGIQKSFDASQLRDGYFVAICATEEDVDMNRLYVVDGRLRTGSGLAPGQHQPFLGFDFLLLRVELFDTRDDLPAFVALNAAFQDALNSLADPAKADAAMRLALRGVSLTPEFTLADQRRLVESLKKTYQQAKQDQNLTSLDPTPTSGAPGATAAFLPGNTATHMNMRVNPVKANAKGSARSKAKVKTADPLATGGGANNSHTLSTVLKSSSLTPRQALKKGPLTLDEVLSLP